MSSTQILAIAFVVLGGFAAFVPARVAYKATDGLAALSKTNWIMLVAGLVVCLYSISVLIKGH